MSVDNFIKSSYFITSALIDLYSKWINIYEKK